MSTIDLLAFARTVVGPGPNVSETVRTTPREVPDKVKTFGYGAMIVGALCLIGGLLTARERTLGVLLTCIVYFMGVSQGGVMFAVAQTITLGRWGRPFKRVAESFWFFMPFMYVAWIVFLLGGGLDLYEWTHETMPAHKAVWLQPHFFIARQIVMLGILLMLDFTFIRNSLRADMGVAGETLGTAAPAFWSRFTAGWKGREVEVEATYQKNIRIAPVIVVCYAIFYSLFAIDAVMSLSPHWAANMFPAWHFVSSFWLAINWICIISVFSRKWLKVDHLMTPTKYLDIGALMFALCIFWTYNLFALILPIWYGNMPEETGFLMLRMFLEPWSGLSKVVGMGCFLFPFITLLSRGIRKTPDSLVAVAIWIAIAVWLERFLMIMPQVWKGDTLPLGPIEIGVFVGFAGAFVTVVTNVLARVPAVPISDPFMNDNPSDVHVHVHEHAH